MDERRDLTLAGVAVPLPPPSLVSGEDAAAHDALAALRAAQEAEQAAVPVEEGEFTLVLDGEPE
jgi:hypothetical protein